MKDWIMKRVFKFKYGVVAECIVGREAGNVSEVAYKDAKGGIIGYWALGSFDPRLPINENNFKYLSFGDAN